MTTQPTERRRLNLSTGVTSIIFNSKSRKLNKKLWTSGRNTNHTPSLTINGNAVESVRGAKFLGVHITDGLTWSTSTTSLVKKAQQRFHFLRWMRRADLHPSALTNSHRVAIGSLLTSSLSVWYGSCPAADQKSLQRVVEDSREDHQICPTIHPGPVPVWLPQESYRHHQRAHNTPSYHLARATAASGASLPDSATAFSNRPSDYSTHSRKFHEHLYHALICTHVNIHMYLHAAILHFALNYMHL